MQEQQEVELERDLRELQEERFELTELQKSKGYQKLIEIAGQQCEARKQAIFLRPLACLDETLGQEYAKGEIAGIELFRSIVQIQVDALTEEILRRTENVDDESSDA